MAERTVLGVAKPRAVDDRTRRIFVRTYDREPSSDWIEEWRRRYEQDAQLENGARDLARTFRNDGRNSQRAREWLETVDINCTDARRVGELPPIAKEIALAIRHHREPPNALVVKTREKNYTEGLPFYNRSKHLQFVLAYFEVSYSIELDSSEGVGSSIVAVYLSPTQLGAIARILFPEHFGQNDFSSVRDAMKQAQTQHGQLLSRYGLNNPKGMRSNLTLETERQQAHPSRLLSVTCRRSLSEKERKASRKLVAWLPWPDGYLEQGQSSAYAVLRDARNARLWTFLAQQEEAAESDPDSWATIVNRNLLTRALMIVTGVGGGSRREVWQRRLRDLCAPFL